MARKKAEAQEKKPFAYIYVGDENRVEVEVEEGGKKRTLSLWRNVVYRNLPDDEAIRNLVAEGKLKPLYA
ncbi:MAG: hypothetical protein DSZ24_01680 [Thermodesulfatator sp.]|nr:MAG: hypothetical protein DSZ24_01680 [Thermodesulfatator sp.]